MSNENTTTAEDAVPQSDQTTSEPLTTQSNPWALRAEQAPNKDLYVPVTDLQFDGQSKLATILAPEAVSTDGDGHGEAVKLSFRMEEELVSTDGIKKSPGYVFRPRFASTLVPASTETKDKDQAERGLKDVFRLAVGAGVLDKRSTPTAGNIIRAIGQLEGRKVLINFKTAKGSKRAEDGNFQTFQNLSYAAPESKNRSASAAKVTSDH